METIEKKKIHYAWWIMLSCGMFIGCVLGVATNSIGVFLAPVANALEVPVSAVVWPHIGIWHLVMAIFLPFSGRLIGKVDIRILMSISVILYASGFFVMSTAQSVVAIYIGGALHGLGGIYYMYNAIPTLLTNWFKKHIGTILGLIFVVSSIVGIFYAPFISGIIGEYGWRVAYRVSGCVMLIGSLPFSLFVIRLKPSEKGLLPYGAEEMPEESQKLAKQEYVEHGFTVKAALKNPSFWILMIGIFCIMGSMEMNNMLPTYAGYVGFAAATGALCSSFSMVGCAVAKVSLGWLSDRLGVMRVTTVGLLVAAVGTFLVLTAYRTGNTPMLLAGCAGFGVGYAMLNVQGPNVTKTMLGQKDFAKLYSLLTTPGVWFQTFGSTLIALLYEKTGSVMPAMYILTSVFLVAAVAIFVLNMRKKETVAQWDA